LFGTHIHTNNTGNVTKQTTQRTQTIHRTTQKIHRATQQLGRSAGRAPSLRVLPWHLPYNWWKSTYFSHP